LKCTDVQAVLDEYLDGELEGDLLASLQMHFGNCVDCRAQVDLLIGEKALYRKYGEAIGRKLQPEERVWPAVQAALVKDTPAEESNSRPALPPDSGRGILSWLRSPSRWLPQLGLAACLVVISIAGTLYYVRHQNSDGRPETIRALTSDKSRPQSKDGGLEAAVQAIQRAEQEYLQAIQVLSNNVDQRKSTLEASLVDEMERNLRSIDESILATRKAYYSHPSDPYLAQIMLAAYSRKVELLQELAS
jgi:hypothetical protein